MRINFFVGSTFVLILIIIEQLCTSGKYIFQIWIEFNQKKKNCEQCLQLKKVKKNYLWLEYGMLNKNPHIACIFFNV